MSYSGYPLWRGYRATTEIGTIVRVQSIIKKKAKELKVVICNLKKSLETGFC